MSSSDSENDCYANAARRLHNMKNKYEEDTLENTNPLNDSQEFEEIVKNSNSNTNKYKETSPVLVEEVPIKYPSGSVDLTNDPPSEKPSSSRRVTRASTKRHNSTPIEIDCNTPELLAGKQTDLNVNNRVRGGGRSRGKNKGRVDSADQSSVGTATHLRGRRIQRNYNLSPNTPARSQGRRSRGNNRRVPLLRANSNTFPTYSIGNTDEYPDQSNDQALFSSNKKCDDLLTIDDNEILDENEELSVKVYWQNAEIFKFSIRKFQKLVQIFDYFSQKEGVSHNKLLLTYNDKILKPDDTPESINYSIVKFIDGGIVNQNLSNLVIKDGDGKIKNGVKIKFQCQNVKKPFEIVVSLDDKCWLAMVQCAEYLEKPLDKLKFEFDGDSISGKQTLRELDFEGGECVDVKILS